MAVRVESRSSNTVPVSGEWECSDCGYYVRGTSRKTPKRCPECGGTSEVFDFYPDDDEDDWEDDDWEDDGN